jgi:hypothetical protein
MCSIVVVVNLIDCEKLKSQLEKNNSLGTEE